MNEFRKYVLVELNKVNYWSKVLSFNNNIYLYLSINISKLFIFINQLKTSLKANRII